MGTSSSAPLLTPGTAHEDMSSGWQDEAGAITSITCNAMLSMTRKGMKGNLIGLRPQGDFPGICLQISALSFASP